MGKKARCQAGLFAALFSHRAAGFCTFEKEIVENPAGWRKRHRRGFGFPCEKFWLPLEGKAFDGETQKTALGRFPSGTPGAVLRFKEVPPRSSATNQNLPDWQVGALPSESRSLLPPRREVCDPPLNTSSLNLISRIISSRNKSCRAGVTPSKFLLTECRTGR